jgi:hypothetical protein
MILALTLISSLARPAACVHDLDTPRPRLTLAEQAETKRVIRGAVAGIGGSKTFAAFLVLVASRESSLQRGLVHRLQPDIEGSAAAWRHTRDQYEGNPFAADAERWQTFGLFGMNSNYFTLVWDRQADPMVLCDAVVDVLVYQRSAARVAAKMRRTGACAPTWANVHAAVSGGDFCPAPATLDRFRRRAARAGIDPDREVTSADLGRGPSRREQDAVLARLRSALDSA